MSSSKQTVINILAIITFIFFKNCTSDGSTELVISGLPISNHNNIFKLEIFKDLDQVSLAETKIDSLGNGSLRFIISEPTFAYYQAGNIRGELYLTPGDKLRVSLSDSSQNQSLIFFGKGADVNNYIYKCSQLADKIKAANGEYIDQLDIPRFSKLYDSLKSALDFFHKSYIDSTRIQKSLISLLEKKNTISLLCIRQTYAFILQNNSLNQQFNDIQNGKQITRFKWPVEFDNVTEEVPFNITFIRLGLLDYTNLLHMYVQNKVYINNYDGVKLKDNFVWEDHQRIKNGNYPKEVKEYLMAKNVQFWLQLLGIKPSTDSILEDFKINFSGSSYLPAIDKEYNGWLAIAKGKRAPDFTGKTLSGSLISLSNLKGKVVYIDVWATWCVPCIAEIPYSKKLYNLFGANSKVEFLNVSIDRDTASWKKMLRKEIGWRGTHVNLQGQNVENFWRNYKIAGIPAYILINQNGEIIEAKASKPSEGKIYGQIKNIIEGNSK
jgi:thiol-disulfide isomerase/thioredoxin